MQETLETYGIPYKLGISRGFINVCCPYCGDTKFHLGYSLRDNYFSCFKCGWHPLKETLTLLTGDDNIIIQNLNIDPIAEGYSPLAEQINLPGTTEFSEGALNYLKSRSYNESVIEKYKLRDGGYLGDYKFRIIIPVYQNKRLMTFTSRSYKGQEPRYKHLSKELSIADCKSSLYNIDNCKTEAVVLEGPADVWRWGDGSIATFGTSLSDPQMNILHNRFEKLHFIFDNEDEAQEKARKYAMTLSSYGIECYIHRLDDKNDIGECTDSEINELKSIIML